MKQTFEAIQTASQYRGRNVYVGAIQSATRSSARLLNRKTNRMHRFKAPQRSNFRAHAHSVSDDLRG